MPVRAAKTSPRMGRNVLLSLNGLKVIELAPSLSRARIS